MTPPLPVVFSDHSRTRVHDIQGYFAFHNTRAAARVVDRIIYAAEMSGDLPCWAPSRWAAPPAR